MPTFLLMLAVLANAGSSACRTDNLQQVVREQARPTEPFLLVARSGRRLRIAGQDFIDPNAWRPGEPLTICRDPENPAFLAVRNVRRGETLSVREEPAPLQTMSSRAFTTLLKTVERECPGSKVRYATPAALLDSEDAYLASLRGGERQRVQQAGPKTASGDDLRCAHSEGASCSATAGLEAIQRAGLNERFARAVCAEGPREW
jgi:hypothetical protein